MFEAEFDRHFFSFRITESAGGEIVEATVPLPIADFRPLDFFKSMIRLKNWAY